MAGFLERRRERKDAQRQQIEVRESAPSKRSSLTRTRRLLTTLSPRKRKTTWRRSSNE